MSTAEHEARDPVAAFRRKHGLPLDGSRTAEPADPRVQAFRQKHGLTGARRPDRALQEAVEDADPPTDPPIGGRRPPLEAARDATALPRRPRVVPFDDFRLRMLEGVSGVPAPNVPQPRPTRSAAPPAPLPADATSVATRRPPTAPEPDHLSADTTPLAVRRAQAEEAEAVRQRTEDYRRIPGPARLAISAGKGVVDASTLGFADDAIGAATEGLSRLTGREISDPYQEFEALERGVGERVAELGGFAAGAGGVVGAQNRVLSAAAPRVRGDRLRRALQTFGPDANLTRGQTVGRNVAEGLPFDLAYDAESPQERGLAAGLGVAGGAGLGLITSRSGAVARSGQRSAGKQQFEQRSRLAQAIGERGSMPAAGAAPSGPQKPRRPVRQRIADVIDPERARRIEELEAEREKLSAERDQERRRATVDGLTGLSNQEAWLAAKPRIDADPERALIVADLNGFKTLNDELGHAAGDAEIRRNAAAARQAAEEFGLTERHVFRAGGDELVIDAPTEIAEQVRDRFEELAGVVDHAPGVRTSVSAAVGNTFEEADQALGVRKGEQKAAQGIGARGERAAERAAESASDVSGTSRASAETATEDVRTSQQPREVAPAADPPSSGYRGLEHQDVVRLPWDELKASAAAESAREKNIEAELFGVEGAKRYDRLQRRANSSTATREQLEEASREIAEMEGSLTPAQQERLFGIGETGLNAEDLRDIARAAEDYSPQVAGDLDEEFLRNTVGREILTGKPDQNSVSAVRLRGALEELFRRGASEKDVLTMVVERAQRERTSPGDAAELARRTLEQLRGQGWVPRADAAKPARGALSAPHPREAPTLTPGRRATTRLQSEAGATDPAVMRSIAGTGAGAAIGAAGGAAAGGEDNRLTGAITGAAVGAVGGRALARRSPRPKVPSAELKRLATREATLTPPPPPAASTATPNPDLDPNEYVNLSKFALDEHGEERLADEVRRMVAAEGLDPKRVVSWKETRAAAESLGLDEIDLKTGARLSGPEMLAIRNIVSANIEATEAMSRRLATDPSITAEERELISRTLAAMEGQNASLLSKFTRARSQSGRDLNNLKILASRTMDPFAWFTQAQRQLGDRAFTDGMRAEITRLINTGDRKGLVQYLGKLRKAALGEQIATVWKAGLLTGPPTHLANLMGNTTMAVLETTKEVPAFVFDRMLRAFSGLETKAPTVGTITASLRGARKGVREAAEIMKGGIPDEMLRRYDISREVHFDNAFLEGYTQTVFRSLTAGDRIFRGIAMERSILEQARLAARREGFRGEALNRRAAELLRSPTDEMALRAIHDAEVATFMNQGVLGQVARGAKRALRKGGSVAELAGEVVMPFTQTPANVASRVVEYSPLGALSTLPGLVRLFYQASRGTPDAALQRKIVERLGRSSVGSAPIMMGWMLAASGRMTTGYPEDQHTRNAWALEGKQENSVLVGGKWRSVERLSPLGNMLVFGANLHEVMSDATMSAFDRAASAGFSIAKTVSEQTFLTGLQDALDVIQNPKRSGGRYVDNLVGSIVPNVVGRLARTVDPVVREPDGPMEAIQARIPFASRSLPEKLDNLGEPVSREKGAVANIADPFYSRTDRTQEDQLIAELARVGAAVGGRRPEGGEGDAAFRERLSTEGQLLRTILNGVIAAPEYQAAPQLARRLTQADERFRGRDAEDLAKEIQREILEQAIQQTRSQYTRARRRN